jgi:HK97 family phage portal protein
VNLADWNAAIAARDAAPVESRAVGVVERRDPQVATKQIAYHSPGQTMVPEWDAESAIRWAYLANSVVYACVQTIAKAVAGCPLRAGGDPVDRSSRNDQSRLSQLLGPPPGVPNPQTTSRRLIYNAVCTYYATGRYAWEIESDTPGGLPLRLWPLAVQRLEPIPSQGGMTYWDGFKYGPPGRMQRLRADQVFYAWRPSITDYRQPESPLQAARLDISAAVMSDRYQVGFLRNNAQPATLVAYDEFGEADDEDAFQRQFLASHRGVDNAGKTMFVAKSGGDAKSGPAIEVTQLGLSQRDSQFLAVYQQKIQGICIALGVPMSMLDASGRTFANSGLEQQNFYEATVLPLLSELADEINMQLAPRLGPEVCWFDTDHVMALRPPTKFQQVSPVDLVAAGIVDEDEVRDELGLPPREAADESDAAAAGDETAQQATTTIDRVALAAQTLIDAGFDKEAVLAAVGLPQIPLSAEPPAPAVPLPPLPGAPPARSARHPESVAPEVRRAKLWRAADGQVRALEQQWERSLRKLFARQARSVLASLTGKRGRQLLRAAETRAEPPSADDLFNPAFWGDETEQSVADLYAAVVAVGGARVSRHFGVDFDLEATYAQDFIQRRANQLAGQVTETTYQAIRDALAAGVDAGEGIDPIAQRIRDVFDEADSSRARLIARTEVISAYNGSTALVGQQLPADTVAGREWIAVQDDRTRADHADADGQVVGVDEPFDVGGEQLDYPGDPNGSPENICNCRCTLALLTPDEMQQRAKHRLDVRDAEKVLRLVAEVVAA